MWNALASFSCQGAAKWLKGLGGEVAGLGASAEKPALRTLPLKSFDEIQQASRQAFPGYAPKPGSLEAWMHNAVQHWDSSPGSGAADPGGKMRSDLMDKAWHLWHDLTGTQRPM
jgi:hypothetical protein